MLLLKFRVVFDVKIQPHHPGNAENVYEIDSDKYPQCAHGRPNPKAENPVENRNKNQGKESSPDVGNEHRTVIVAGFGFIIKVTYGATPAHFGTFHKGPATRLKGAGFLTTRAFDKENTMRFGAFLKESSHKAGKFFAKVRYLAVCAV